MKRSLVIVIAFVLSSCKSEIKENSLSIKEDKEPIKEFIVEVEFKTNAVDVFKLSLNDIKIDEFQKKSIQIEESVSPTSDFDRVKANFGSDFSNRLTINFGLKEIKEVTLKGITLYYGDKTLNIAPNALEDYFRISRYIDYDSSSGIMKTKEVENRHVPVLILKQKAINAIKSDASTNDK